jgi:hypothetical protein
MQRAGLDALRNLNQRRFIAIHDPEIASRIASYELAFRMQSAAPELIDLSGESQATLDAYGVNRADPPIQAARGGGPGQYRSFATNCLLARRLVERGVRFVNIVHASWDHHSNLDAELPFNAGMADQPIAAMIKDLKQRGLLDETLILWCSEFGRTPLGENRNGRPGVTGRDHHPFAFTLWMAGGGIKGGHRPRRRSRKRLPRDDPAPVRARSPEADAPVSGPGFQIDGCRGESNSAVGRVRAPSKAEKGL